MHAIFASLVALLLLFPGGGWLGVYLSGDADKAVITEVIPDSPAAKAGLLAGDVVLAVGDVEIASTDAAIAAVGKHSPGDRVRLVLLRDGKKLAVEVTLGRRPSEIAVAKSSEPAPAGQAPDKGRPGGEVKVGTGKPYLGLGLAEGDGGVLIEQVLEGAPAAKSSLRVGDVVRSVGDRRIRTLDDFDAAFAQMRVGEATSFGVQRGDARLQVVVVPGARGRPQVAAEEPPPPAKALKMPHAQVRQGEAKGDLEQELEALRAELRELRQELRALKKQLGQQRK